MSSVEKYRVDCGEIAMVIYWVALRLRSVYFLVPLCRVIHGWSSTRSSTRRWSGLYCNNYNKMGAADEQ